MGSANDVQGEILCRDCGRELAPGEVSEYLLWGEVQMCDGVAEGICNVCFNERVAEGEGFDEILAEFCG